MNNDTLFRFCRKMGLDIFAVADLEKIRDITCSPPDLPSSFSRAIVIGVHLSDWIFANMPEGPTALYQAQYSRANDFLDHAAFRIQAELQKNGRSAVAIPSSQVVDEDNWQGAFFHQAAAIAGGVGWVGKNFLVVHPVFGPRIRLATILTDLPLKPAKKMVSNKCRDCRACVDACPVGALSGAAPKYFFESRADALDAHKCAKRLIDNAKNSPVVSDMICGLCIAACPQGRLLA